MNKELIKTYFEEFKHWLSGGNVQVYYKKDDEPKWLTDEECIEYEGHDNFSHIMQNSLEPEDVLIIINDKYATYRKALAEGKIVEVATDYNDVDGYIWKSMEDKEFHHFNVDEIRIKPEEPKFKVGDWLIEIYSGSYAKVLEVIKKDLLRVNLYDSNATITTESTDFILWQPKLGEWCWFWDSDNFPPKLRQFKRLIPSNMYKYESCQGLVYLYCEPFLGKLPTTLKGL